MAFRQEPHAKGREASQSALAPKGLAKYFQQTF